MYYLAKASICLLWLGRFRKSNILKRLLLLVDGPHKDK